MDDFVKAFIKSSVTWLAAGVTLGVAMAARPQLAIYRTAHLHMLVLGFVAMMIFGVGYHVIPRFAGHPLRNPRAARTHWWLANIGLASMALGFAGRANALPVASVLLAVGGTCAATGAYIFAFLIWRSVDGPKPAKHAPARKPLPMAT